MQKERPNQPFSEERLKKQTTNTILMVCPDSFGFNPQTANSNSFQHIPTLSETVVRNSALGEFQTAVATLQTEDINVLVLNSPTDELVPDAVFPNNWLTTHPDGTLTLYPMFTPNRRAERQEKTVVAVLQNAGFAITKIEDFTHWEKKGKFLEGTGSLVIDHPNRIAYGVVSPRTSADVFAAFCKRFDYFPQLFHAIDVNGQPIYHTNVVMTAGDRFTILCTQAIPDEMERQLVVDRIKQTGNELIDISFGQMSNFCGNCLQVRSSHNQSKIIMSQTAFENFTQPQKEHLERYGKIVPLAIPTIETVGGGSARCLLAEVFLPHNI